MTYRKKLIEVSLPLEAINKEAAREKSIRHGHPSTLHLWWARRPLAACRAVLFASLVDDPSEYTSNEEEARKERERLFDLIEELVKWENSNNEEILDRARLEIARSVARTLNVDPPIGKEAIREFLATKAPPVLDPFAGGGSIPLEAQRLGLRAYASDLNPVAVLINKAIIEIPPKFANMPPVHPLEESDSTPGKGIKGRGRKNEKQTELWTREWKSAEGLAEDVRYYGKWMRDEAFKRIGHLYPPVTITKEMLAERPDLNERGLRPGNQLNVIAWLWARTVRCPNPACGTDLPLVKSFSLSVRKGKEAWVEPVVQSQHRKSEIKFIVRVGKGEIPDGTVSRNGARCLSCDTPVPLDHIRGEGQAGRLSQRLMAMVVEDKNGRLYLSPQSFHETASQIKPEWIPDTELSGKAAVNVPLYGFRTHGDLFTSRQLITLTHLSDLISHAHERVLKDAVSTNPPHAKEYANAIATYLGFGVSRLSDICNAFCMWENNKTQVRHVFTRQAIPMLWDFAEPNVFGEAAGDFQVSLNNLTLALERVPTSGSGTAIQADATTGDFGDLLPIISTDPPYYDNVAYADLADFFYVWLRRALSNIYPELLATVLTPKSLELVATPYRFNGDRKHAEAFFEEGLHRAFHNLCRTMSRDYPLTVYYAFKQIERQDDSADGLITNTRSSTGWETMLQGLLANGFQINGTWPMRTELANRSVGHGANALASSIVLVCRPRPANSPSATRREFLAELKRDVAPALRALQQGSVAPVDFAQVAIGPGMAVFSRYSAVLEADGKPMSVRTALALINQALDEFLTEQEGDYDSDTRWALAWFEQFGHSEAPFGLAETLSRAKNTSVNGLEEAGLLEARAGKVRLYRRDELDSDWDPAKDRRATAWEAVQHLIHQLENGGEESAAVLLAKLGPIAEPARDLAYRLYTVCERKGWAQDALGYNMLVVAWPRLKDLAARSVKADQGKLL